MSVSIEQAFIRQYEAEVHAAYQRQGSLIRNTVRTKNNIKGEKTTFQKVGKGSASQKSRHGDVPVMSVDHATVDCSLTEYHAADYVDEFDELKIQHDERQVIVQSGVAALGRKTDELLVAAMAGTTVTVGDGTAGVSLDLVMDGLVTLGNADVPQPDRTAIVGWAQWAELLKIDQFAKSEYVGADKLPFAAEELQAKRWLGTLWMAHSGLPLSSGVRSCFWYHKSAIGHAIGQDVKTVMSYQAPKDSTFINNKMSMGTCLIDPAGCLKFQVKEA
jgi:hypothetical protein